MFKKWMISLLLIVGLMANDTAFAAKHKSAKKQTVHASAKHTTKSASKRGAAKLADGRKKTKGKQSKKKGKKTVSKEVEYTKTEQALNENGEKVIAAPLQMIAQNKEKSRISDSVHKTIFANVKKEDEEGYFASMFAAQKKAASFQTLEGTAAVFKSISGWEDKKFYVLTNQLPVGTIVRITTADLKSICAKVINVLPEVGNAVQYRLNDAAVAILGITNKTFQVSVTY
jgi:hypothetical protein